MKEMLARTIRAHTLATGVKPERLTITRDDHNLLARRLRGEVIEMTEYHGVALNIMG